MRRGRRAPWPRLHGAGGATRCSPARAGSARAWPGRPRPSRPPQAPATGRPPWSAAAAPSGTPSPARRRPSPHRRQSAPRPKRTRRRRHGARAAAARPAPAPDQAHRRRQCEHRRQPQRAVQHDGVGGKRHALTGEGAAAVDTPHRLAGLVPDQGDPVAGGTFPDIRGDGGRGAASYRGLALVPGSTLSDGVVLRRGVPTGEFCAGLLQGGGSGNAACVDLASVKRPVVRTAATRAGFSFTAELLFALALAGWPMRLGRRGFRGWGHGGGRGARWGWSDGRQS